MRARFFAQQPQSLPRAVFWTGLVRPIARVDMSEIGVLFRREFRARTSFAPQIEHPFFVLSRIPGCVLFDARARQRCDHGTDFFTESSCRRALLHSRLAPPFENF